MEIGPGIGVITGPLSESSSVIAVELDRTLAEHLADKAPRAEILLADALGVDWVPLLASLPQPAGIVSNMPYNITGPLLEKVYGCADKIDRAVLMMQKEVAEKMVAKVGDSGRGALSVVFQDRFEIGIKCQVPPGAFSPPPKVESTVLVLRPRAAPVPGMYRIAHAAFRQPRKTLANNLKGLVDAAALAETLREFGLAPTLRPHQVPDAVWPRLVELAGS